MKARCLLPLLLTAILFSLSVRAAEPRLPSLSMTIDVMDSMILGIPDEEQYLNKDFLRRRLQMIKDAGFSKVYFRGQGGVAYYPSRWRRMWPGGPQWYYERGLRVLREYDILAESVRLAHEIGLKIYYWETPFDNHLVGLRYFPGTPEYGRFGEWPWTDTSLIKLEHCVAHRRAALPVENLKGTIARLELHAYNVPEIDAGSLAIYTAPHGEKFARYDKPFQVEVRPSADGQQSEVVITGLEITNPCIKLLNVKKPWKFLNEPKSAECARAFYTDGSPVELFCSCEYIWQGDAYPEYTLWGASGTGQNWGLASAGKHEEAKSFIIRFGDFDRYARGFPEYAYRDNCERLENIVTELFEKYPGLDGVTFSIRTHNLPCGGSFAAAGCNFMYGFSQPIVDEYKKRYGVDILTEQFDERLFLKLRGEYFTQMLRGVAAIVHRNGGKFEVMAPVRSSQVKPFNLGAMYPWWPRMSWQDFFDVKTWAREGIVDNVILLGTGHKQNGWPMEWQGEVKAVRRELAGTDTKLTLHYLSDSASQEEMTTTLTGALQDADLDEVEFYSEFGMWVHNKYPWVQASVRAAREALDKAAKAPRPYPAPVLEEDFNEIDLPKTDGLHGQAAVLGGGKQHTLSQGAPLKPDGGTIAFWFKPLDWDSASWTKPLYLLNASAGRSRLLIYKYAGDQQGSFWNDKVCFYYGQTKDDAGQPGYKMVATAAGLCRRDEWMHITVTWSPTHLKIYYNGRLQAENAIVLPIAPIATLQLGDGDASCPKTAFDRLQIFDRELTAQEIAALYAE